MGNYTHTMPKGSGLAKALTLSPELASNRTNYRIRTINSISLRTLRWSQYSGRTKSEPSGWRNSRRLICQTHRYRQTDRRENRRTGERENGSNLIQPSSHRYPPPDTVCVTQCLVEYKRTIPPL